MEQHSHETLSSVLNNVFDVVKCSVCLSLLQPPFSMCLSGHGICSDCKEDIIDCPKCRADFSNIRPLILENIICALPKVCTNQNLGCNYVALYSANNDHEAMCPMRIVPCQFNLCKWSGKASYLLNHLKTEHDVCIFKENSNVQWNIKPSSKNRILLNPVNAYECIFWKYAKLDIKKKKLLIFFHCVPTTTMDSIEDFYFIVTFSKENTPIEYKYSQKCLTGDINYKKVFEEENCMAVPFLTLPLFIDVESTLKYTFCILKFKSECLNKPF